MEHQLAADTSIKETHRDDVWSGLVLTGAMALVALSGVLLPAGMLIDLVYNVFVRRLLGAPRLPITPTPRRFSYVISTALLASSALAFFAGAPAVGFLLGGLVVVGGAILSTTLWCLGSWIYWTVRSLLSSARLS